MEPASWIALKHEASAALVEWKKKHPQEKIDDAPFWMTGEVWGHGPERSSWHDAGFDSMINFDFQRHANADWKDLDSVYLQYADELQKAPHDMLSYISSHDTALFDRNNLKHGLSALLLAPGGVQLFYGDESGRKPGAVPDGDPQQATRSDMNWTAMDAALLAHAQKLVQFRARHVALARGRHARIGETPYAFSRIDDTHQDRVVVVPEATGEVSVNVRGVFADGTQLKDAYSGRSATVKDGTVKIKSDGMLLLENA